MTTYTATSIRALRAEFLDGEPAELVVADALSAYADLLEQREQSEIERLRSIMRSVAGQTTDAWASTALSANLTPAQPVKRSG